MRIASGVEPGVTSHILVRSLRLHVLSCRWPCAGTKKRNYDDICPLGDMRSAASWFPLVYAFGSGWSLEFGQICSAPSSYKGRIAI